MRFCLAYAAWISQRVVLGFLRVKFMGDGRLDSSTLYASALSSVPTSHTNPVGRTWRLPAFERLDASSRALWSCRGLHLEVEPSG
ncbi:MAG TPA: hypothetical protein VLM37_03445 [Fibrobacteraceae bacterium]|nr:hypothetical protein [Fibrobacteraceae bacterium]